MTADIIIETFIYSSPEAQIGRDPLLFPVRGWVYYVLTE